MERKLYCHRCGALTAVLRDARVMRGIITYCPSCVKNKSDNGKAEAPDFLKDIFGL